MQTGVTISDNELLSQLREGDHDAYTEIYNRYNGPLYLFAYNRLRNREESKDIIHELFLALWKNHAELYISSGLPAYLYASVRNRIITRITHEQVAARYIDSFREYMETENSVTADHLVRHNELLQFIEKEIAALPPKTRLVFELSRKTHLTRKEIAQELQLSEETVKSHMHSALKTLKIKLGPLFYLLF
jgi:RNA polymerase sigma-70 factor (family 1)